MPQNAEYREPRWHSMVAILAVGGLLIGAAHIAKGQALSAVPSTVQTGVQGEARLNPGNLPSVTPASGPLPAPLPGVRRIAVPAREVGDAPWHIYYSFSPSLLPQLSHIKLILNGTLFATVQPTPGQLGGSSSEDAEAELNIPPELLVHDNALTIQFIGHYTMVCEDPANTTLSTAPGRRREAAADAVS